MEVSKICGTCAYYRDTALHGIICEKTKKPVGYLQQRDCWASIVVNATTGEDIQPKSSPEPKPEPKPEKKPEKKPRKGGRKAEFPKYTDEKTGLVMKFCRACRTYKPLSEFNLNATNSDGYGTRGKKCHAVYMGEYLKRRRAQKEMEEEIAKADKHMKEAVAGPVINDLTQGLRPVEVALSAATDLQLFEELKRRGFQGTLSKGQYTI